MCNFHFIHSINDLRDIALIKFDRCTAVQTFWPAKAPYKKWPFKSSLHWPIKVPYSKFDDEISELRDGNGKPLERICLTVYDKKGLANTVYIDNDFDVDNDKIGFQKFLRDELSKKYGQQYDEKLYEHIVFPEHELGA